MLEIVLGEQTVGGTQVSDWFSKSKSTEPYLEECEHSGCQVVNKTGENVDQVENLFLKAEELLWKCQNVGNFNG